MQIHLNQILSKLELNVDKLRDYLKERYFEQLVPIVFQEDTSIYYDIIIE